MAVPKKRMTSTRSGNRRSHLAKKIKQLGKCPKCKSAIRSHRACPVCGSYKEREIIKLK